MFLTYRYKPSLHAKTRFALKVEKKLWAYKWVDNQMEK